MLATRSRSSFLALLACGLAPNTAYSASPPLPQMSVPRTNHPPVIDGILQPGEWDRAAACTGFVTAFDGKLAKTQSTAWMTFDDKYIYVAFKNYRSEKLTLLSVGGRRMDDDKSVYDPSNEIWISPPGAPATTFQTLVNSYPAILDVKMIPSVGYTSKAWSGKWEVASHQSGDSWTIEARAPISAFGVDRIADGATWHALFATDVLSEPDKFRAWAPGGAFADIARHGIVNFTGDGPAFQLLDVDALFTGKPSLSMAVVGATRGSAPVQVTARFGGGIQASGLDTTVAKTYSPAPGVREAFQMSANLGPANQLSRYCEITAKSGNTVLYHQVIPFTADGSVRRPPATVRSSPYQQAFGLEASYAPLSKKLLIKIDRYYMPQRTTISGGIVRLTDPKSGRVAAERAIAPFRNDYSEFPIDLKDLAIPTLTDQAWEAARQKTAPSPAPAEYLVQAVLTGRNGSQLATASTPAKLMGQQFEWLPNQIGISNQVIAPWTPVQANGAAVSLWNKTYGMTGAGLADRIVNSGSPQLSGPMRLEALIDGRQVTLAAQAPRIVKSSPAEVELAGDATAPNLKVSTNTRVEFDGFVWNAMTIQPTTANVGRLSLVVTMPESEAPFFVTTSGGWSSYFGDTPQQWDSRESSLPSMTGNFVPYVFLTDSERGFSWFADNEKGWRLDPALPTQELRRQNGAVTLRIHFINKPGPIPQPMTIQYGWMVTPQKPQPKGWRGYLIGYQKYFPQSTPVFWNEADWAVSWPYYSSPFPHNYEKSKQLLAGSVNQGVAGCVGNIAHAIARYADYKGREFTDLAADWGITPGDQGDGNIARSRGPNDFDLFHFDRWSKLSGLGCVYFDENYLSEDWNYLTGGAYLQADGSVQPGYSYLGLREYNKRLRYMFNQNGKSLPNLWEHTTGGHAVYAWMPDVSMEAENVEPTDLENDYLAAIPASRLRSIGMGRNLGSAPFVMSQTDRHWAGDVSTALTNQLVGWVLSHDVLPESVPFWPVLSSELELWRDDVRFLPYWKKGAGIDSTTPGVNVSAHARPGNVVLWIVNTNRQDAQAVIHLDLKTIGLDPSLTTVAYDAETGEHYALQGDRLSLPAPKRMWRAVRIFQPKELTDKATFVADFDREVAATEAYGGRYPLGPKLPATVPGKSGNGAPIDAPLAFLARQHVSTDSGTISFQVRLGNTASQGAALLNVGGVTLNSSNGRLALNAPQAELQPGLIPTPIADLRWHFVVLHWKGKQMQVSCDGATIIAATLKDPLKLPGSGRGSDIRDFRRHIEPASITFGPMAGGVIDDLRMGMQP